MKGKSFQREKSAMAKKHTCTQLYVTRNIYIHPEEVLKTTNRLEKLQRLGPRDHCPVSKLLRDNKHLSSNCPFKTLCLMQLWVTSCPQEQLGNLDQVAFTSLKYCSNRLVFPAGVIQRNGKTHSTKIPSALREG